MSLVFAFIQSFWEICWDPIWQKWEDIWSSCQNLFAGEISCLPDFRSWKKLPLLLSSLCSSTRGICLNFFLWFGSQCLSKFLHQIVLGGTISFELTWEALFCRKERSISWEAQNHFIISISLSVTNWME